MSAEREEFIRTWNGRALTMLWVAVRLGAVAATIGATCSYLATHDAIALAWWAFGITAASTAVALIVAGVCALKANDARSFPSLWSAKYQDR